MNYFNRVHRHISDVANVTLPYRDIDAHNNSRIKASKLFKPRGKTFDKMCKLSKTTKW